MGDGRFCRPPLCQKLAAFFLSVFCLLNSTPRDDIRDLRFCAPVFYGVYPFLLSFYRTQNDVQKLVYKGINRGGWGRSAAKSKTDKGKSEKKREKGRPVSRCCRCWPSLASFLPMSPSLLSISSRPSFLLLRKVDSRLPLLEWRYVIGGPGQESPRRGEGKNERGTERKREGANRKPPQYDKSEE